MACAASDELQDALLREIHHRFYNSLQVIYAMTSGLLRQRRPDGAMRAGLERIQDRIAVLGQLHRVLADPVQSDGALAPACEQLCANLVLAFDRPDTRIELDLGATSVEPMTARGILLLLAELVTNALKHTAGSAHIAVGLQDDGCGPSLTVRSAGCDRLPARTPRVAAQLAESLGGRIAVCADDGFEVRVDLPA